MQDRARIHVDGRRRRRRLPELPARGARAEGRTERRRRRSRRRRRARVRRLAARSGDVPAHGRTSRRGGAATARARCATARTGRRSRSRCRPGPRRASRRTAAVHDLVRPGQRAVVARGGPGGRGNKRFAGPTHQTPRFAERGLAGDETWITLQLKLLADVGPGRAAERRQVLAARRGSRARTRRWPTTRSRRSSRRSGRSRPTTASW